MDDAELTLRDYLGILRRHRVAVLAAIAICLLAAVGYSLLSTPRYESTASVLLRTSRNQQLFPPVGATQEANFWRDPGAEFRLRFPLAR